MWDKNRALFDSAGSTVDGCACLVESAEPEDSLGVYETNNYKVVACTMRKGEEEIGCYIFCCAGYDDKLS